jgi:hypothetical protein
MFSIVKLTILLVITCLLISGCLYRSDGVFNKIGDSDYKARINFLNMFAVADGRLTCVSGIVTLEDRITPLKNAHIILTKKDKNTIVSNTNSDHVGKFVMSGVLFDDSYIIEIDSSEYIGRKEINVKLNYNNWAEIIAYKK